MPITDDETTELDEIVDELDPGDEDDDDEEEDEDEDEEDKE